jgi:hypothetical protein
MSPASLQATVCAKYGLACVIYMGAKVILCCLVHGQTAPKRECYSTFQHALTLVALFRQPQPHGERKTLFEKPELRTLCQEQFFEPTINVHACSTPSE